MFAQLFKQPFHVTIFGVGALLVFAGFFKIDDITKLAIVVHANPLYIVVTIGFLLMVTSIALHFATTFSFHSVGGAPVKRLPNGFSITRSRTEVKIVYGRVELISCKEEDCLTVLPANEFFDDECIADKRSALGAFMQHHFPGDIGQIQGLVKKELRSYEGTTVEKSPGETVQSYGVGTCVFLNRPLKSQLRVAMVAVTTKRAGEGLQAYAGNIHRSIVEMHRVMADKRLNRVVVPLLGAGHGGLPPPLSLVCMLAAFGEIMRHPSGHHLKSVDIVVFRESQDNPPIVTERETKRILAFAQQFFMPQPS